VARERRDQDLLDGTLIAAVCPGLIDTDASRPWFDDMSQAQSPAQAAEALLELALSPSADPAHHGQLVRFGQALDWYGPAAERAVAAS
jgi:NAD(P)-dependent dehydrogenase (short-subunit alcohol dehydrogenase family)